MHCKLVKTLCVAFAAVFIGGTIAGCSGGKIDGEQTALIINGESIPYGEINFYIRYEQAQSYYYMGSFGFDTSELWNSEYAYEVDENGYIVDSSETDSESSEESSSAEENASDTTEVAGTYGDYFKEVALEDFIELVVARQKAVEQYGLEISEEEQSSVNETVSEFMDTNEDAEAVYGATSDMIKDILEMYIYKSDLKPYITENVDREVSDEEAAQTTIMYIRIKKNDEDTSADSDDEDTKTNDELLAEAEEVLTIVKDAGDITADDANDLADEVDESFYAMEYSMDQGSTDTFPDEVNEALLGLSDGEVYGEVIDTDSYYYIVKMISYFDEEKTESEKESIISQRETDAVNEIMTLWMADSAVEKKECFNALEINDTEIYTYAVTSSDSTQE